MNEIKPVVIERFDLEYRNKSKFITLFDFWDYRDFDAKNKLIEFLLKHCFPPVDFTADTLLKEVKPVVTEEKKYEYRHKLKLIALCEFIGL